MRKTYRQFRPLVAFFLFFCILFGVGLLVAMINAIENTKYLIHVGMGIYLLLMFSTFARHYGRGNITIENGVIRWEKAKFIPKEQFQKKRIRDYWHSFLFGGPNRTVNILVTEEFLLQDICKFGLLEDFSDEDFLIDERMPGHFMPDQLLVFQLKDGSVYDIRLSTYWKKTRRRLVSDLQDATGIQPGEHLKEVLDLP